MQQHNSIHYTGLNDLNLMMQERVKRLVNEHTPKLRVHNTFSLDVHIAQHSPSGKRHKYVVHMRLSYPGGTISTDKVHGWDILQAVRHALKNMELLVTKRFQRKYKPAVPV
ncbi:MAG: hypothetical protein OXR66_04875 [Candidatus Woesearchaeota archaeon]|nr:hypothetical protein [Candidatus Woesearchaeota archaeon]